MWNSRRNFIGSSVLGIFGVIPVTRQFDFLKRNNTESHGLMNSNKDGVNPLFPTQDPDDVRQVVGAAHTKLDVVKELVTARPELAKPLTIGGSETGKVHWEQLHIWEEKISQNS